MTFGENLIKIRKSKNMTQEKFAKEIGIGLASLQRYESGERSPTLDTLNKIADGLKIGLRDIVGDIATTYMFGADKSVLFDEEGILWAVREQFNLTQEYFSKATGMELERYIEIEENKVKPTDSEISAIYNVLSSHGFKASDMIFMKSGNENWVWISRKKHLLYCFDQLNEQGQEKAVESVELLTKIPEYKK